MKNYFLSILALMLTAAFVLSISACNTVNGVGKDMHKAGDEISAEAKEHQHKDKD